MDIKKHQIDLQENGFTIINHIFSPAEVEQILTSINQASATNLNYRKSTDIFAIRQFLKEIPESQKLIFSQKLIRLIEQFFGNDYFVVKSIYFDKPEKSNWFVSYHQDLTISVDQKIEMENFGPWTKKQNQFAVQPPLEILERNFTIRIHLDNTDEHNGALKVIPKSHLKGIYRPENINWDIEKEMNCSVWKGGIMIMKPLLLHASSRTSNNQKRRVFHIEFSNYEFNYSLNWSERLNIMC